MELVNCIILEDGVAHAFVDLSALHQDVQQLVSGQLLQTLFLPRLKCSQRLSLLPVAEVCLLLAFGK